MPNHPWFNLDKVKEDMNSWANQADRWIERGKEH